MWPLLVVSIVAVAAVFERLVFLTRLFFQRDSSAVKHIFSEAASGDLEKAGETAAKSSDYVARVLACALAHRQISFEGAVLQAAGKELRRFNRGIAVLDTIITLAPLLGLFGTVTGMIRAFRFVQGDLGAPSAITGGIAEALIATAFGLVIAMIALLPFNFLNARLEQAREEIEAAAAELEMVILRVENGSAAIL